MEETTINPSTSDIFISYARKNREQVLPLADVLVDHGWSVWWDPEIQTGQQFHKTIERALAGSSCVIVVWSEHSVRSRWVLAEADEGANRNILVPILIEEVTIPLAFRGFHSLNLVSWSGDIKNPAVQTLIRDIEVLVGPVKIDPSSSLKPTIPSKSSTEPDIPKNEITRTKTFRSILFCCVTGLGVLSGILWWEELKETDIKLPVDVQLNDDNSAGTETGEFTKNELEEVIWDVESNKTENKQLETEINSSTMKVKSQQRVTSKLVAIETISTLLNEYYYRSIDLVNVLRYELVTDESTDPTFQIRSQKYNIAQDDLINKKQFIISLIDQFWEIDVKKMFEDVMILIRGQSNDPTVWKIGEEGVHSAIYNGLKVSIEAHNNSQGLGRVPKESYDIYMSEISRQMPILRNNIDILIGALTTTQ